MLASTPAGPQWTYHQWVCLSVARAAPPSLCRVSVRNTVGVFFAALPTQWWYYSYTVICSVCDRVILGHYWTVYGVVHITYQYRLRNSLVLSPPPPTVPPPDINMYYVFTYSEYLHKKNHIIHFSSSGVIYVTVDFRHSTSLTLSWPLVDDVTVTGYRISYSNTDTQCFTDSDIVSGIAAGETSHTLSDLEEGTEYTITVTALLTGGGNDEDSVTATTLVVGQEAKHWTCIVLLSCSFSLSAPSAPPVSVSTSDVTSSSITVQWGAVDCIHHNGDITDYSVRYGVQGSAEGDRTVVMVSGDSSGGMYEISGLNPSTNYTIGVGAVNSAGTGVYSSPVTVMTSMSGTDVKCVAICEGLSATLVALKLHNV